PLPVALLLPYTTLCRSPEDSGGRAPVTAVDGFTGLSAAALAGLRLGLLHGRLSAEEKETVMTAFRDGAIDVLVCTTVIEVGVDRSEEHTSELQSRFDLV